MNTPMLNHIRNVDYAIPEEIVASYEHIYDNTFVSYDNTFGNICFGCTCDNVCIYGRQSCICIGEHGPNYDIHGKLLCIGEEDEDNSMIYAKPLFECNSCCSCDVTCSNRVVQGGLKVKLQVFPTIDKGFGVRTLEHISRGTYVIDYAGEVLSTKEALSRLSTQNGAANNYLLSVKENSASSCVRTHIDAARFGNVSRFINHSCDPNLVLYPVRVDSVVPRLALFAIADIIVGTELSFDYSGGESDDEAQNDNRRRSCKCGMPDCKGLLPSDPTF
eukprot:gene18524-20382_t